MPDDTTVTVLVGQYASAEDASTDLDYILADREEHLVSTFDGAVVEKDESGNVKIVRKHETPVRFGAWSGLVVGGVVGLLFPPLLVEMAAAGTLTGSVVGHFWKGMSRNDVRELGEALEGGNAALVIAVDTNSADTVRGTMGRATSIVSKVVAARSSDINQAIADVAAP